MAVIRHIRVENFRGIRELDWHINERIVCLVGPGDSCKTTILDAIEYGLWPYWNLRLSDADFYQGDTTNTILIELTIGELPKELFSENKCGLYLRGYDLAKGEIIDDPDDTKDTVLTIRLQIDKDLEPQWTIVKNSNPEGRAITNRSREAIGMVRLGDDAKKHLTWSRGSALAKLVGRDSAGDAVVLAYSAAKNAIAEADFKELEKTVEKVKNSIRACGVKIEDLKPGLDMEGIRWGQAAISLCDKGLPLRVLGLGSQRLAALAIQQTDTEDCAISLIDEVEHGLEPHRIRQFLKKICDGHRPNDKSPSPAGQVIMTTHSPTPIMVLNISEIQFVRCHNGSVVVSKAPTDSKDKLQPLARTLPHAFLARRLIVCEGKTEEALCRALEEFWVKTMEKLPLSYSGVATVIGGGSNGPSVAKALGSLSYDVLYFGDSDRAINPTEDELQKAGIEVYLWPEKMCTENRLAHDLPMEALRGMVHIAVAEYSKKDVSNALRNEIMRIQAKAQELTETVRNAGEARGEMVEEYSPKHLPESTAFGEKTPGLANSSGDYLDELVMTGYKERDIRQAVGQAAVNSAKGWFKNINSALRLGEIVAKSLSQIPDTPTAKTITKIHNWIYGQ